MDVFDKCRHMHPAKALIDAGFNAYYRIMQSAPDSEVVADGRRMIMLGSNNYLGLAADPRVKAAAQEAVATWGAGTTGSRLLNGTLELHADLERRIARFLRKDDAIFYTSGYLANCGAIAGLAHRGDVVVLDKQAHASIVDGARLSYAEVKRFRHNDVADLERVLASCGDVGKLVVVDGIYSMEGALAPLPRIVQACRSHGARLIVDDAHGLGVMGRNGRGTAEHFGVEDGVDVIVGTASKALPAVGGFVAGAKEVIEFLRYTGANRAFYFAASPPAAAVAAVREALAIVQERPALRTRLWAITRRMLHALRGMGFDTMGSQTPIVPIHVGTIERAFELWRALSEEGIFVNVAIPPAVPAGGCLIRMTVTAAHTDAQIDRVLDALERSGRRVGLLPADPCVREGDTPIRATA
jgi:8-amino-7-oxononanoate synthase